MLILMRAWMQIIYKEKKKMGTPPLEEVSQTFSPFEEDGQVFPP